MCYATITIQLQKIHFSNVKLSVYWATYSPTATGSSSECHMLVEYSHAL